MVCAVTRVRACPVLGLGQRERPALIALALPFPERGHLPAGQPEGLRWRPPLLRWLRHDRHERQHLCTGDPVLPGGRGNGRVPRAEAGPLDAGCRGAGEADPGRRWYSLYIQTAPHNPRQEGVLERAVGQREGGHPVGTVTFSAATSTRLPWCGVPGGAHGEVVTTPTRRLSWLCYSGRQGPGMPWTAGAATSLSYRLLRLPSGRTVSLELTMHLGQTWPGALSVCAPSVCSRGFAQDMAAVCPFQVQPTTPCCIGDTAAR